MPKPTPKPNLLSSPRTGGKHRRGRAGVCGAAVPATALCPPLELRQLAVAHGAESPPRSPIHPTLLPRPLPTAARSLPPPRTLGALRRTSETAPSSRQSSRGIVSIAAPPPAPPAPPTHPHPPRPRLRSTQCAAFTPPPRAPAGARHRKRGLRPRAGQGGLAAGAVASVVSLLSSSSVRVQL